jgi:hypothetical protein
MARKAGIPEDDTFLIGHIAGALAVTGRIKTSHLWALQNQPV